MKVSFSPELKFTTFGGSLGGLDYGFSYPELQPAVVAAGHGESTASWVFATAKGYRLRGGKAVHLVVAAPAGTLDGQVALDLVAFVTKPGFLPLPMGLLNRRGDVPAEPMRVSLW